MNREYIENYLRDWKETSSTNMDNVFNMFKSDVNEIAKGYEQGIVYVYDRDEYIEFCKEDCEEEEKEKRLKEIENEEIKVIIDDSGNDSQYFIK